MLVNITGLAEKGEAMPQSTELISQLPNVEYVRRELGRNLRERDLLRKLLKIVEERSAIERMATNQKSEVRHA